MAHLLLFSSLTSVLLFLFSLFPSSHTFPLASLNIILPRDLVIQNTTGTPEVFNTDTSQVVPQSRGTDGSGYGFDASALIWLGFCFAVGAPMAFVGMWGWKRRLAVSRGAASGLAFALCSWSALTNTLSSIPPISDLILTLFALGFFLLGFLLGLPHFTRHLVAVSLGIQGGLAFGIRVILLRQGLLFGGVKSGEYAANWVLAGAMGFLGGVMLFVERTKRPGLALSCASTGTFLTFVGIDLVLNKQTGMSTGLRFLFDRNDAHFLDIMERGYNPPPITIILLAVSLGLTPVLGYIQYRFFPPPPRISTVDSGSEKDSIPEGDETLEPPQPIGGNALLKERRSFLVGIWDAARFKGMSPNRFSL